MEQRSLIRLRVTPVYGWGWTGPTGEPIDVPPPFDFVAEAKTHGPFLAYGDFNASGHPLSGNWIRLSQRHTDWDGQCNIAAFSENPCGKMELDADISVGFAEVAVLPDS